MNQPSNAKERILAMLAERKAAREATAISAQQTMAGIKLAPLPAAIAAPATTAAPSDIVWNPAQLQAIELMRMRKPFVLLGSAGTGKTTSTKAGIQALLKEAGIQPDDIALVSYTNRAVRNIAKATRDVGADGLCKTVHKLLEFMPEFFEIETDDGDVRTTMRFVPKWTATNPLHHIKLVIVDEASMLSVQLHQQLVDACPNATIIYIGDLNQLRPVFGDAILGYKLLELPVIELTEVYRQALESPIVWFQHNYTLAGKLPSDTDLNKINDQWKEKGLEFKPFTADSSPDNMGIEVAKYMIRQLEAGLYNPASDTILIPYNHGFGVSTINEYLAEHFAKTEMRVVHEIIAGFEKHYYANGDFVMYAKRECTIIDIGRNRSYFGQQPQPESTDLSRWGWLRSGGSAGGINLDVAPPDNFLELLAKTSGDLDGSRNETDEERKQQASHWIKLQDNDTGDIYTVSSAGDINGMAFGWCMTIHKSQGSEWRKVWLVLCKQHRAMLSREILYTGMTRAREHLTVIYTKQTTPGRKDNSIARCIKNQSIPGKTWREKAEYFKGKAARTEQVSAYAGEAEENY